MENIDETKIAKICSIKHITEGEFVKGTGWNLNYVNTKIGKIYRVNIIGIIVSKNLGSIQIGDKDSIVEIKLFKNIEKYNIGDIVLIIGRPREFNDRTIIVSEIVKKYNNASILDYRYMEICNLNQDIVSFNEEKDKNNKINNKLNENNERRVIDNYDKTTTDINELNESKNLEIDESIQKNKTSFEKSEVENPNEIIIDIIQKIDDGDGADMQKVIDLSKIDNCEEIITTLLEIGEIFNNKPGKLKVL